VYYHASAAARPLSSSVSHQMNRRNSTFTWQRVVLFAALFACISFGAAAIPLIQQALKTHEVERINSIYANGLTKCAAHNKEVDAFVQSYLPGNAIISIDAFPTFSGARAIRIVGEDLYLFELASPQYNVSNGVPALNEATPKVLKTHITSQTSLELATLLASDIDSARAPEPMAIDGTTYVFQVLGQGCAFSWSPSPDSRAGKITSLFHMLAKQASLTKATDIAANDQAIYTASKALVVN